MVDNSNIIITAHACQRFSERSRKLCGEAPKNPEKSIRKLLREAEPEEIKPYHRVTRLLNNSLKDCAYLQNNGWRFVLAGNNLVTIERIKSWQN